eukprot:g3585.t1
MIVDSSKLPTSALYVDSEHRNEFLDEGDDEEEPLRYTEKLTMPLISKMDVAGTNQEENRFVIFLDDNTKYSKYKKDDTHNNKHRNNAKTYLSTHKYNSTKMSLVEANSWLPSKSNPCYHQIIDLTNCVKKEQEIRKCLLQKNQLEKCEILQQYEQQNNGNNVREKSKPASSTDKTHNDETNSNSNKSKKWQDKSFSFRACAGIGRDCPHTVAPPAGELAGKMKLPPPPPDKSGPNPAGPDVTDSAGLIVMCIDHSTMGSLVPETVDHFSQKAQQEWPRVLTVALIDGVPSEVNDKKIQKKLHCYGTTCAQPTNGDGPGEYVFKEMQGRVVSRKRLTHTMTRVYSSQKQPQLAMKPLVMKPQKDLITLAKEKVENAELLVQQKSTDLKLLNQEIKKVHADARKALADAKAQANKAVLEKDEDTKTLETKRAKEMEKAALIKMDLVASMNDEVMKASKKSNDAAERASSAKIYLRNLLHVQEDKKILMSQTKVENSTITPAYRNERQDKTGIKHALNADKSLYITRSEDVEQYRMAAITSVKLVSIYTEMAVSYLSDGDYAGTLQVLSDAERSGTLAYNDLKLTVAKVRAKHLAWKENVSPGMNINRSVYNTSANTSSSFLPYHKSNNQPITMRFKSKASKTRALTKLLPIREYEEDHDNTPGRSIPMPLLTLARKAAEKDSNARYAITDAINTKNILEGFVKQCEIDKSPIEKANDNMDEAFRMVAKALVDQHMVVRKNGRMKEEGGGANGEEIPPELVHNVKRVRIICETLLEQINDMCKLTVEDALDMAKLAWVKARIKKFDSAKNHRLYLKDMAIYIGSLYEDALQAADLLVKNDEVETKRVRTTRIGVNGTEGYHLHTPGTGAKGKKRVKPVKAAAKKQKSKPKEKTLPYKNPGKIYDDVPKKPCTSPNCDPGIKQLDPKTSFLEVESELQSTSATQLRTLTRARGRPHLNGIRTGLGALPKLITNELMHSLTSFFIKEITEEFTYRMTPQIANSVVNSVKGETMNYLAHRMKRILSQLLKRALYFSVPATFNALLPGQLLEQSQNILTNILTRSITHSLVPTLTYSLANIKDLNKYSHDCVLTPHGRRCQRESRTLYAKVGIANYYSAFFSDYYGDYYTDKRKLDNLDPRKDGIQHV